METNSYIKQYPDLMAGKKIMYVHGFASSAQSGTVKRLRTMFPQTTIIAEDIPVHPAEGFAMLSELAQRESVRRWAACTPRCSMASTASSSIPPSV